MRALVLGGNWCPGDTEGAPSLTRGFARGRQQGWQAFHPQACSRHPHQSPDSNLPVPPWCRAHPGV